MLLIAMIQLLLALYLLIFSTKIANGSVRRFVEIGIAFQYFFSMALVMVYLVY